MQNIRAFITFFFFFPGFASQGLAASGRAASRLQGPEVEPDCTAYWRPVPAGPLGSPPTRENVWQGRGGVQHKRGQQEMDIKAAIQA